MAAFGGIQAWQRMVASGSPSPWDGAVGTIWSRDVGGGGVPILGDVALRDVVRGHGGVGWAQPWGSWRLFAA